MVFAAIVLTLIKDALFLAQEALIIFVYDFVSLHEGIVP